MSEKERTERRIQPQPEVEPVNVLLIDDRPENLIALEATLKCREYTLFSALSGEEALKILAEQEIALVLLDIQMPGMDGYEVASRIKNDPRTANIPVMLVTAIFKEDPHVLRGYEAGAVDYIGKPFDIEILRRKVAIYTQLHLHRRELRRQEIQQKLVDAELLARSEELDHRSAQITTLLESIRDPIFVVWQNTIKESNTPALRLFGYETYDEMATPMEAFFDRTQPRDAITGRPLAPGLHPYFQALNGSPAFGQVMIKNARTGADQLIRCGAHPVRIREKIMGVVMVNTPVEV